MYYKICSACEAFSSPSLPPGKKMKQVVAIRIREGNTIKNRKSARWTRSTHRVVLARRVPSWAPSKILSPHNRCCSPLSLYTRSSRPNQSLPSTPTDKTHTAAPIKRMSRQAHRRSEPSLRSTRDLSRPCGKWSCLHESRCGARVRALVVSSSSHSFPFPHGDTTQNRRPPSRSFEKDQLPPRPFRNPL